MADRVTDGNLDQDDPGIAGILDLHLGQAPTARLPAPARSGTPAAASRACPALTSWTWIQVITGRLGGSLHARRPRAAPGRGRTPARDRTAGRTPGRWPGRACHGSSDGCGPGRSGAAGPGCSGRPRHYCSITLSDADSRGERTQCRLRGLSLSCRSIGSGAVSGILCRRGCGIDRISRVRLSGLPGIIRKTEPTMKRPCIVS